MRGISAADLGHRTQLAASARHRLDHLGRRKDLRNKASAHTAGDRSGCDTRGPYLPTLRLVLFPVVRGAGRRMFGASAGQAADAFDRHQEAP